MKTNGLTGAALDWAVAKCEGYTGVALQERTNTEWYSPSTDWAQGGPIIEREKLTVTPHKRGWSVEIWDLGTLLHMGVGKTPLIAAMRCYVASKLGDNIDIPEELT